MIPNHPSGLAIVARVAALYGVGMELLLSKTRDRSLVEARRLAWWKIREDLFWSYPEIARCLGTDHSNVLLGVRVTCKKIRDGTGSKHFVACVQALANQWPDGEQDGDRRRSVPPDPPLLSVSSGNSGSGSLISSDPRPDSERAREVKSKRSRARSAAPDRIEHSDRHRELARTKFLDLERETEMCLSHHRAKGNLMANWGQALTTWLLRSNPGAVPGRPPPNPRTAAADAEIDRRQQRDIELERARVRRAFGGQ